MAWRLFISQRAERDLSALDYRARQAIIRALSDLATDYGSADVRKLGGRAGTWRLRVGGWRAILKLDNRDGLISVTRILPRGRAYRR